MSSGETLYSQSQPIRPEAPDVIPITPEMVATAHLAEVPVRLTEEDLHITYLAHELGIIAGGRRLFSVAPYQLRLLNFPSVWGMRPIPRVHADQMELV